MSSMVKWLATTKKPMKWEMTPTQCYSNLPTSTPKIMYPTPLVYCNLSRNVREHMEETDFTALTRDTADTLYHTALTRDTAERSVDSAERSPDLANRSHEQDESPRPIFNTPWSAATRINEKKRRPEIRRRSTVTFNDKTVYHEYKTRARTPSQEVGGRTGRETKRETRREVRKENRAVAAYGGKGEHPGVITTVVEMTGEEIKCEDCYVVISSYSSLKQGRWGLTPVSVVQSLTHRDVCRTHTLMLFREMDVLSLLRHPYIVQLLGVCSGPQTRDVLMVLEPFPRGTLYSTLHKQGIKLSKREIVDVINNICCALDYVHKNGYIHNGVSSHSIFLGKEAKLGNMGYVQPVLNNMTFNTGHFWQWNDVWINEEEVSTVSDVYSLGCVMWECLTGKVPWSGLSRENVILHVCKGKKLRRPKGDSTLASITMQILGKKIVSLQKIVEQLECAIRK
ncbi:uncharacterized protein LOC134816548 [Bolinopsis microptera]|uniref:uncharacterized protein LOC134816548 n=1 Tax=Bolinopsis microptera TaxID=2820187 RepID=UPI003079162C